MGSKLVDSWWFGDEPRDHPFWLRDKYPSHRDPSGFEVVSSMNELADRPPRSDNTPGDSAIWAFQLNQYVASKSALLQPSLPVDESQASPYRPTMPHEARVFELFPRVPHEELQGRLHHVDLGFEYGKLDLEFAPGGSHTHQPQVWRPTDFGISLPLKKKIPYTAVSYVWGSGEFSHVVRLPGHNLAVTATVDTILRRLRLQTSSVFLWLDQICVNQQDLDDKTSQVQLMGTIYSRARNTIAWLGDEADNGALRALQGLYEAAMGRDEDLLEEELEYLRHPLNEDADTFDNLMKLSNRPWFQRTWIVQEAILSHSLFLMIGSETVLWDDFGGQCASIDHFDLFEDTNADVGNGVQAIRKPGLKIAAEMRPASDMHFGLNAIESLLTWLIRTRSAAVTNPLDKVYGVLGLCSSSIVPKYTRTKEDLFYQVTADAIEEVHATIVKRAMGEKNVGMIQHDLTRILDAIDHDPEFSLLPSWVVDWSLPRRTVSLASTSSVLSMYKAGGGSDVSFVFSAPDERRRLGLRVAFFDTIVDVSHVFANAELTNHEPKHHNIGLKEAVSFANRQEAANVSTFFEIFCSTLVAGKDRSGMNRSPREYIEILSLLCDETTGNKPSVLGQAYTIRQSNGYFTLSNLSKRQPGRIFQNLKRAFRNAVLNRRLCWTSRGHLGLVPRFVREVDEVCVVPGLAVPLVLRRRGEGEYVLLGVAYVHEVMDGEWISEHKDEVEDASLV